MNIQLLSKDYFQSPDNAGFYTYAALSCGKHSLSVSEHIGGGHDYCNVTINNASHKVWRRGGRTFPSVDAAIEHYRSSEVKAMLSFFKTEVIR